MDWRARSALCVVVIALVGCAPFAGRAAAPDEAGDSPAGPQRVTPEEAMGPTVQVHVESRDEASLVRLGENDEVVERCSAPCDRQLPSSGTYRIDGPAIRSSWPFHLDGAAGSRIVLSISPSLRSTYGTGKTLGRVGGTAAGVGFALALFGALAATSDADANNGSPRACPGCTASVIGGGVLMLAGIGVATAGVVMALTHLSSDTSQRIESPSPQAPAPPGAASPRVLDVREAAWPRETDATLMEARF